jgi:hypothetical protein
MTSIMIFFVGMTLGRDLIHGFSDLSQSWTSFTDGIEARAETRLSGEVDLSIATGDPVDIMLVNAGTVSLGNFAEWDVIFEIQEDPGLSIDYLLYTDIVPGADRWTVMGIYLDGVLPLTEEIVDPGVLNPGEKMIVRASPTTVRVEDTYNRAVFVTPEGISATVVFASTP